LVVTVGRGSAAHQGFRCTPAGAGRSALRAPAARQASVRRAKVPEPGTGEAVARPFAVIADAWQAEAVRCWGEGPDGKVSGWIADMLPSGCDYSARPDAHHILERPAQQRRWQCRTGTPLPQEEPTREADCRRAMRFFEYGGIGGTVVDVGCGDGFFARRFARSGAFDKVLALDVSWSQLEGARDLAEREGLGPEDLFIVQGDVEELPFRDGQVACAMWGMGVHLVEDPLAALRSICRTLNPNGGRLFATGFAGVRGCSSADDFGQLAKDAGFTEAMAREEGGVRYALLAVRE